MSHLIAETRNHVLRLTLNRPDRLNAMSGEMIDGLHERLSKLLRDREERAVLITGAGRGFCSGADLAGDGLTDARLGIEAHMMAGLNRVLGLVRELPVPVVAALNGPAAGAGCGLALAADLTIAARSATLLTAFSRIGAVLDGGLSWTLVHRAGPARALGMAFLGDEPISAETAKEWGLLWDVVDDDRLAESADQLAERLASGPTRALGLIKRQIASAQNGSFAEALRFEAACQGEAFRTDDFLEGVAAYQERRPPRFEGR